MEIFTVSMFGHRRIDNPAELETKLERVIGELIRTKPYVEFLIGREGEFDILAASVIRRMCKKLDMGNAHLTLVLPYMTAQFRKNQKSFLNYYDDVCICSPSAQAYFKAAIKLRNHELVDQSDLVICYVKKSSGGAYGAMRYALDKDVDVIDLAECL